jgi:hypothetical protein
VFSRRRERPPRAHSGASNVALNLAINLRVPVTTNLAPSPAAIRARRTFLRFFPGGFEDDTYFAWERGYKVRAHEQWNETLNRAEYQSLLRKAQYAEIANRAVRIESRTNLLFSFEKMALRDAVKTGPGARAFARGLYKFVYGDGTMKTNFDRWCGLIASLPRRQTRVLTWPLATVFGFIALPKIHIFYKPRVTQLAAKEYGFDLRYTSRPSWDGYNGLLRFASQVRRDLADMRPRDMIDIQSFLWVLGSDEY